MTAPTVYLVANGDERAAANRACEAAQAAMEGRVVGALERLGARVARAHGFDAAKGHSFIDSQAMGREVLRAVPADAPLVVATAVWQYSQQVLPGLLAHRGPLLTVANWSGEWPGLVGLLNLNACLAKAGRAYGTLWSETFDDAFFLHGLGRWLRDGGLAHDASHVRDYAPGAAGMAESEAAGVAAGRAFRDARPILGVFDEGCMGMYNAIVPDELLHAAGASKERLSQSQLYAAMRQVSDADARAVFDWLAAAGLGFRFGDDDATELTRAQVLEQCRMYVAALRIADARGCDAIGIQYQLGLTDLAPASDLVEGLLNNVDRPPVRSADGARELYAGEALPHFNEVDECAGLDGLLTYRLWRALGYPPENTLHDLRWGRHYAGPDADGRPLDAFVWVLQISGAAPPAHLAGGYRGAASERQPPMYFRLGGGTLKGVGRPGPIVWSRVFVEGGRLHADVGLGDAVALPEAETAERWRLTTSQWPIVHAVLRGVTRDQMMARHRSNHVQIAYAPDPAAARRALFAKAAALDALGVSVHLCGEV